MGWDTTAMMIKPFGIFCDTAFGKYVQSQVLGFLCMLWRYLPARAGAFQGSFGGNVFSTVMYDRESESRKDSV